MTGLLIKLFRLQITHLHDENAYGDNIAYE